MLAATALEHDLHLVTPGQDVDVCQQVASLLARIGCLQIHDATHARIDRRDVERAARLERDAEPRVAQRRQQLEAVLLRQRFAARCACLFLLAALSRAEGEDHR